MAHTIAVEKLRVGMFIHLEGGWMSHPFPLSAFRIGGDEQLATLRGLGLKAVRWSPERSDPEHALPALNGQAAADATEDALRQAADCSAAAAAAAAASTAAALAQRRRALTEQRDVAQRCERHYGEAAKAWREASEAITARPQAARAASVALVQGMLDQLLGDNDIAIRLVNGGGGDRASAHALNVSVVSLLIGRALGLPDQDMLDLGVGALLHDIGKQDLPARLHHVEDGFTPAELAGYRDHVAKGVLQGKRLALSAGALSVLAQHHEHADASGFPQRLNVDRMSAPARIVAIVNRYDNLCNPPPRVPALTPHEAVSTLFAQGRNKFDAAVLGAFIRMMGVYPAGSLVQLTDDRFAMVVGVNSSRPLKPRVLVHEARVPRSEALFLNLEEAHNVGIRRSLVAAKLPTATLEYLDPRPRVAYFFEVLSQERSVAEVAA